MNEIDRKLAVEIMGWDDMGLYWADDYGWAAWIDLVSAEESGDHVWAPTENIDDAFRVAEKMERLGFEWGLHFEGTRNDETIPHLYVACFGGGGDPAEEQKRRGIADTAPMAICKAVLNTPIHR